jgi:hypothetical protein
MGLGDSENLVLANAPTPSASMTVIDQGRTRESTVMSTIRTKLEYIDFDGKSSYWSFFSSVRRVVTTDSPAGTDTNDEADCDGSIHQPSPLGFGNGWRTAVLTALPPRGVVDFLAATFFRFAQGSRCYIHPEIFSRKLTAFYNGTHEFEMQDSLGSQRRSTEFISLFAWS